MLLPTGARRRKEVLAVCMCAPAMSHHGVEGCRGETLVLVRISSVKGQASPSLLFLWAKHPFLTLATREINPLGRT